MGNALWASGCKCRVWGVLGMACSVQSNLGCDNGLHGAVLSDFHSAAKLVSFLCCYLELLCSQHLRLCIIRDL